MPGPRLLGVLAAMSLAVAPACWRGGAVTESGKGLPVLTLEFPERTAPGSEQVSVLRVHNPGPGDIGRLVVSFVRVGAPASEGLPNPIVDPGRGPSSGKVVKVEPRPLSVSPDGVVYRFTGLAEGDARTIEFTLRVPRAAGLAANSVTVYDDLDPARARGARLETTVEG